MGVTDQEDVAGRDIHHHSDEDDAGIDVREPRYFLSAVVADTAPKERAHYREDAADHRLIMDDVGDEDNALSSCCHRPGTRRGHRDEEALPGQQEGFSGTQEDLPGHF